MAKYKAGLHKEIPTIFDGVPIPKNNGAQQSSGAATPEHPDYALPEPPTPGHLTPTAPKPQQPEPAIGGPKAATAKQLKADATIKTARQIWWQQTAQQMKNKLFTPKPGVSATRQKVMAILVPGLSITLIFVLIQVFSVPSRKATRPRKFGPADAVAASTHKIDWQIPAPYPTTLRDPMQFGSVTTAQGTTGGLIVKGIVYSKDKPSAVIGTQIVHEGDKVLDATVVKINKDSVDFERNGKRWTQRVQR